MLLKLLKRFALLLVSTFLALLLLETVYRYQWFDFYRAELDALNTTDELSDTTKKRMLIGGDSFTAAPHSYAEDLRKNFPDYTVINSSIPGTGILQASFVLPARIKNFPPEIFIYQLYTGNDLLDISHPTGGTGFLRGTYWWLSDRFRVLSFLNYKAGNVKYNYATDLTDPGNVPKTDSFSIEKYSAREKLQFKAEPALIENSLYLENGRDKDYAKLSEELSALLAKLPEGCKIYLLVIPHAAQVSPRYLEQSKLAGSTFTRNISEETNYPLYERLRNDFPSAIILDPLTVFRESDSQEIPLFYPNDPHLSPAGQRVLGNFVCGKIKP